MTYELTLQITDDRPEGQNIEHLSESEHVSREEAARKLLATASRKRVATPSARRIVGLFSSPEDAVIMDEALEIALADRERRNTEPPHA